MIISQCVFCKHYNKSGANVCAAFPAGIPEKVLLNEVNHQKPVTGDNGIRFSPKPDVSAEELKMLSFGKMSESVTV